MKHWYALYTKPRNETQVETWLRERGTETYLPTVRRRRRRRDRPDRVVYFPCYLFARFDFEETAHSAIAWLPGLRRIVSAGEQPVVVADEVVELIRSRLEGAEEVGYGGLRPGDRVRITSGPLRDLEAIFERPSSATERVRVLLDVLGRMIPIELESTCLTRA